MKRVTVNFKDLIEFGLSNDDAGAYLKKAKDDGRTIAYDSRNGIYCIDPTCDIYCYKNYINYLNMYFKDWKNFGYLDLGLVPILILPSFMTDAVMKDIGEIAKTWQFNLHMLPPTSFLQRGYIGGKDLWVKRDDLAKYILHCEPEKATLSYFLDKVLEGVK